MADTNRSRSKKGISYIIFTIFVLLIVFFTIIALRPEILSLGSSRFASQVAILPLEAAVDGGQWRLVSQWQNPGIAAGRHLYLIEFKDIPGWVTPGPVLLKQGASETMVEGLYTPINYDEHTILTLVGSSTMAHRLVPELAQAYLKNIGADEVRKVSGNAANETIVQGIFYSTKEIRTILIKGQGTAAGITALADDNCDVAMANYRFPLKGTQLVDKSWRGSETEFCIGMDAVAVIVSTTSPVEALSLEEVKGIFSGDIDNWSQIGGPDAPINVFILDELFGARLVFQDTFMDADFLATANVIDAPELLAKYIAQDSKAIGFNSVALANQCLELPIKMTPHSEVIPPSKQNIKNLSYPGYSYLYFYLKPGAQNIYAQDFMQYSLSEAGQNLVSKFGFVSMLSSDESVTDEPVSEETQVVSKTEMNKQNSAIIEDSATSKEIDSNLTNNTLRPDDVNALILEHNATTITTNNDLGALALEKFAEIEVKDDQAMRVSEPGQVVVRAQKRIDYSPANALPVLIQPNGEKVPEHLRRKVYQEYQDGIRGAVHLSTVFRFKLGRVELDQESLGNVHKLAAFFKKQENKDKQLILVGFSDTAGDYSGNLSISRSRAQKVASALKAEGLDNVVVLAAGEEDPEQPNDTRTGREKNRRVEVWMR